MSVRPMALLTNCRTLSLIILCLFFFQFTEVALNRVVESKRQATFEYGFIPNEAFSARPFGLTVNVNYKDDVSDNCNYGIPWSFPCFHFYSLCPVLVIPLPLCKTLRTPLSIMILPTVAIARRPCSSRPLRAPLLCTYESNSN